VYLLLLFALVLIILAVFQLPLFWAIAGCIIILLVLATRKAEKRVSFPWYLRQELSVQKSRPFLLVIVSIISFSLFFLWTNKVKELCATGTDEFVVISQLEKGVLLQGLNTYPVFECGSIRFLSCFKKDCPSLFEIIHVKTQEIKEFSVSSTFGFASLWTKSDYTEKKLLLSVFSYFQKQKDRIISIYELTLSPQDAALFASMLFGGANLSNDLKNSLRDAGILHAAVVSGANIALVSELVAGLVVRFKQKVQIAIRLIFITLFVAFCGFSTPPLRALIAFVIHQGAEFLGLYIPPAQVFYLTLIIELLLFPTLLFSISFYLTTAALYVIVIFIPTIKTIIRYLRQEKRIRKMKKEPSTIAKTLLWIQNYFIEGSIIKAHMLLLVLVLFHDVSMSGQWKAFILEPFIELISIYGYIITIFAFLVPISGPYLFYPIKIVLLIINHIL